MGLFIICMIYIDNEFNILSMHDVLFLQNAFECNVTDKQPERTHGKILNYFLSTIESLLIQTDIIRN